MRPLALKQRLEASRAEQRAKAEATAQRRRAVSRRAAIILAALIVTLIAASVYPVTSKLNEFQEATWQYPWFFLALPLVLVSLVWGIFLEGSFQPRLRLGTVQGLRGGPVGMRVWLRDVPAVLRFVALGLGVAALARPVTVSVPALAENEGIDAVVVLDLSGSMAAVIDALPAELVAKYRESQDGKHPGLLPTRLDAAKAVIQDFIERRQSDRLGIVVFGKAAYVLSPLTLDYQLLHHLIRGMDLNTINGEGTAIGDAVGTAVARLRNSKAKSKAVILLTDGENTAGTVSPELSARLATKEGVKVYTIQIGQGETAQVFQGYDLFGQPMYGQRQFPVNPVLLKSIADTTGGQMYIASDAQGLQASFHAVLDQLEKSKGEATIATFNDLYRYLLLPAVLLVALEALLRAFVLRRFP